MLHMIDLQWREKMAKDLLPNQQSVEERMNKWKKEYEARMKADMQAELTRIRQFELSNIRLEEQEKASADMQDYREDLEKKFQDKLNKLRDRERETLDKCAQKMKDLEQYNHEHRQKIIKDFELLKLREDEVEKGKKLNDEKLNVEKIRLETLQKELKNKIKELDDQKLQGERKTETDKQMAKLEVYKEVQQEQLEYIQKKKAVEEDLLRINQIKDSLNTFKTQNKQVTEENASLVERNQDLSKKKSELENDLRLIRDNLQTVNESYRREQGNVKNLTERIRMKEEEITFLKNSLKEKDDMSGNHKQQHMEQIKKFNNEVQGYQYKIDKLENELRSLRKEQIENEDIIKKGLATGVPQIAYRYPVEDLNVSKMQQSFAQRLTGMQSEHQQYREQRKRAIQELMMDNEDYSKKEYNMKFDNVWDLSGSQVDLQPIPKSMSRPLQAAQQEPQILAYQPPQQSFYQSQQIQESNLDKMDVAQSQVMSEFKKPIIREQQNQNQEDEYSQQFDSSYGQSYGQSRDKASKGQEIFSAPKQQLKKEESKTNYQRTNLSPVVEDTSIYIRKLEPKIEDHKQDIIKKQPKAGGARGMLGQLKSISNERREEDDHPQKQEEPPKISSGSQFGGGQKFDPLSGGSRFDPDPIGSAKNQDDFGREHDVFGKKDDFNKRQGGLKSPFPKSNLPPVDKKDDEDEFPPKKQSNLPSLLSIKKEEPKEVYIPPPVQKVQKVQQKISPSKEKSIAKESDDYMDEPVEDFDFEEIEDDDLLPQ